MNNDSLKEKLNIKLQKNKLKFDEIMNNTQLRNIAFGSVGCLSKGSKSRLYNYRKQIGCICNDIKLTEIALKIVNEEEFNICDLRDIYTSFLEERNSEYGYYFYTDIFPLRVVKEMINLIFDIYNFPYRKKITNIPLKYKNQHNGIIFIELN